MGPFCPEPKSDLGWDLSPGGRKEAKGALYTRDHLQFAGKLAGFFTQIERRSQRVSNLAGKFAGENSGAVAVFNELEGGASKLLVASLLWSANKLGSGVNARVLGRFRFGAQC